MKRNILLLLSFVIGIIYSSNAVAQTISKEELALFKDVYQHLHHAAPNIKVILQTYFESIDHYEDVISLPE